MDIERSRTWVEIHLENIVYNYRSMRSKLSPDTKFLGVVKANAYGHGAIKVASVLEKEGCDYLAVAALSEAIELREAGIKAPILILGYTPPHLTELLIKYEITQGISSYEMAKEMSQIAVSFGTALKAHLKIDSGMGRLGFTNHDGVSYIEDAKKALNLPGLDFEGIFTHFAVSEIEDHSYTDMQFDAFNDIADKLENASGKKFMIRHCSNSGAMMSHPDKYLGMVRPGISLYGLYPGEEKAVPLRPCMELKTRVYQIKEFEEGFSVSYGRRYKAPSKRKIAVIPIGYADGLHRVLSGKLEVLIRGKRAKQVGNICMDMCMIDVTDIPDIALGDVVTVFGTDGDETIYADEPAEKAGTISYELLCAVSPRVPRIYTE